MRETVKSQFQRHVPQALISPIHSVKPSLPVSFLGKGKQLDENSLSPVSALLWDLQSDHIEEHVLEANHAE